MRHVIVYASGRVQGVGYRASVHARIRTLNVTGYVRNMPDGTVELDIQGERSEIDEALTIAREGSSYSSVHDLNVTDVAISDNGFEFVIKR